MNVDSKQHCAFSTMNVRSFYGKYTTTCRPISTVIRQIPEDSDDSMLEDEYDNDIDDPTYNPPSSSNINLQENQFIVYSSDEEDDTEDNDDNAYILTKEKTSILEDEDDSALDNNENATTLKIFPATAINRKKKISNIAWKVTKTRIALPIPSWKGSLPNSQEIHAPIVYFKKMFDDNLLDTIAKESNLYSVRNNPNKPISLTKHELEQFIGISCFMSIYKLPRQRMYWNSVTRISQVADIMSLNRWESIKKNIHLSDKAKQPSRTSGNYDKLYKVRPLITKLNATFGEIPMGGFLSLDEQIVPFKGKSSLKQYNPKKFRKWGYKLFVLSGVSGLVHKFEVYTEHEEHHTSLSDVGTAGNVVLRLAEVISKYQNYKLYFDNWFNGIQLQVELAKNGIQCLGTVRPNRLTGCTFISDKDLKTKGRGAFEEQRATVEGIQLNALKWFDNKSVTTLSTYAGAYPCGTTRRWNRISKTYINIECPSVILLYNKSMGGVDLLDSLLALYRIHIRSRKCYHRLFFHFIDMAIVQSWLLYRRDSDSLGVAKKEQMSLLVFKAELAQVLCLQGKNTFTKRGCPSNSTVEIEYEEKKRKYHATNPIPYSDIRRDQVGHWPVFEKKKERCKLPGCKEAPKVICQKCETYLCFTISSNCFYKFHN